MKKLVGFILILFLVSSCNKPTLPQILVAIKDSLNEAHSQEWLNETEYTFATDAISTAQAFALSNMNKEDKKTAVVKDLVDAEAKIPSDSKIRPYFDWAIKLIPFI